MPIHVGLLTEGHDHLILGAYLAKLLDVAEGELEPDVIDGTGHGWQFVERTVDRALRRFYEQCVKLAILSMDNDGNLDLRSLCGQEDPRHPRHWLHSHPGQGPSNICRWCRLKAMADATRPYLNWLPNKPGNDWPILIAVPVESTEAWLITTQAIVFPGNGSLHAEQEARSTFKNRLYGRPEAREEDVQQIALPMIRQLSSIQLQTLITHARSFADFEGQVARFRDEIMTALDCW